MTGRAKLTDTMRISIEHDDRTVDPPLRGFATLMCVWGEAHAAPTVHLRGIGGDVVRLATLAMAIHVALERMRPGIMEEAARLAYDLAAYAGPITDPTKPAE